MRFIVGVLYAILLWPGGQASAADGVSNDSAPPIPAAWLVEKIRVEAAEAEHPGLSDERVERFPEVAKAFGFQNGEWESLKASMKPGDEIWTFASPDDYWKNYAGRAGVALVRTGVPIKAIVTVMN
jgi:hypothetical protein